VKGRGIIFSAPMIRALLEGRKSQTRRVVKPQPSDETTLVSWNTADEAFVPWRWSSGGSYAGGKRTGDPLRCPYGAPGDRLYVKETAIIAPPDWTDDRSTRACQHVVDNDGRPRLIQYLATAPDRDAANDYKLKATPPRFMPRWASRITLELTAVRVERLQEISEGDAIAEGLECAWDDGVCYYGPLNNGNCDPRFAYRALWEGIHGAESWAASPWVWVLEFKQVRP
jgi:hypothetical protein